jgi:hypothetical protein
VLQGGGGVPNAHYVLVKALSSGTAQIDRPLRELGDFSTNDYTTFEGHAYSNKAPGLALLCVPAYSVMKAVGVRTTGDPARMLWALGLVGVVLPGAVLLVLAARAASRLAGEAAAVPAAVALGAGTLVLPYATIFLSHVLSALLVFAAFSALWEARRGPPRLGLVASGGLLAGLSVTTEYPNALAAAVLGVYALLGGRVIARAVVYGLGLVVGVLPLLVYHAWAFGSAFHSSYEGSGSLFGAPQLVTVLQLLFSQNGLLVLTPVTALGVVGGVLAYRGGHHAEVAVVAALTTGYVVLNAAYRAPFGGFSPGTRHLLPIVPFAVVLGAVVLRRLPLASYALGLVSVILMAVLTATYALAGYDGQWFDRLTSRQLTPSAASLVGITGWWATLPFFALLTLAIVLAARAGPRPTFSRLDWAVAVGALLAWALLAATAPTGAESETYRGYWAVGVVALAAATAAAVSSSRTTAAPQ